MFAALNSAPINLAECDSDLRRGGEEMEEEAGGLVADGVAGGPGAASGDSEAEAAGLGDGRGSGDAREEAARAGVPVGTYKVPRALMTPGWIDMAGLLGTYSLHVVMP